MKLNKSGLKQTIVGTSIILMGLTSCTKNETNKIIEKKENTDTKSVDIKNIEVLNPNISFNADNSFKLVIETKKAVLNLPTGWNPVINDGRIKYETIGNEENVDFIKLIAKSNPVLSDIVNELESKYNMIMYKNRVNTIEKCEDLLNKIETTPLEKINKNDLFFILSQNTKSGYLSESIADKLDKRFEITLKKVNEILLEVNKINFPIELNILQNNLDNQIKNGAKNLDQSEYNLLKKQLDNLFQYSTDLDSYKIYEKELIKFEKFIKNNNFFYCLNQTDTFSPSTAILVLAKLMGDTTSIEKDLIKIKTDYTIFKNDLISSNQYTGLNYSQKIEIDNKLKAFEDEINKYLK